MENNAATCRMF